MKYLSSFGFTVHCNILPILSIFIKSLTEIKHRWNSVFSKFWLRSQFCRVHRQFPKSQNGKLEQESHSFNEVNESWRLCHHVQKQIFVRRNLIKRECKSGENQTKSPFFFGKSCRTCSEALAHSYQQVADSVKPDLLTATNTHWTFLRIQN